MKPRGQGRKLAIVAGLVALAACGGGGTDGPPRHVLLVSIDTLRADYLGCYGDTRARTATIDGLAAGGVLFEAAVAPTPITLPSHAALLTGINPWRLGIRHNGIYSLAPEFETLAETLSAEGYDTAAVIAGYPLTAASGLNQGFAHYDDAVPLDRGDGYHVAERPAGEVTDRAIAWVESREDTERGLFLFVHYYDPHVPYDPPADYMRPTANPREEAFEAYRGEIAYVDDQLRRLLDALEQRGLLRDTLVVVTADHGEGFMQHGELTHGLFLYDELIRVPLILTHPGSIPAERRVDEVVGLVDLAPTVLAALGLPAADGVDGSSLWEAARGSAGEAGRTLFAESQLPRLEYGWAPLRAARTTDWKYIDAPEPELYDLAGDPGETRNLVDSGTDLPARMLADIEGAFAVEATDAPAAISDEDRARLQSLGYLQGAVNPGPASGDGLPDPKRMLREYNELQVASFALAEGRAEAARRVLAGLTRRDPGNVMVRCRLADAHAARRDLAGARRVLEEALRIAEGEAAAEVLWRLAGIARRQADYEQALTLYRRHAEVAPLSEQTAARIAEMLSRTGRAEEAESFARDWLDAHPRSLAGWKALARLHVAAGRQVEANRAWQRVLELRPADAEAAQALAGDGRSS